MWERISSFILRYRLFLIIGMLLLTAFMAWQAKGVRMSYQFGGLLPKTDSTFIEYTNFVETFSEDGNTIVIGVNDSSLWDVNNFREWYELGNDLKRISIEKDTLVDQKSMTISKSAVDSVFSVAHSYNLEKNTEERKFEFNKIVDGPPQTQQKVDSIKNVLYSLPFYKGLLFQDTTNASLMMVFVNPKLFNSGDRGNSIEQIHERIKLFEKETGIETHISGLPYIRTQMMKKIKGELQFFVILAALVTSLLLLVFFKNFQVMITCLLVVCVGVIWSMGMIAIFDYPLTMLMGLIPPLMIVIGIPNCIYLLNKYHSEYKKHGNQMRSLSRVIHKVGNATFLTNMTTALGFATFMFTHSQILREFGLIASINIMCVFIISLIIIPIVFSYLKPPKRRHVRHLDRKWLYHVIEHLQHIVTNHRRAVYIGTVIVLSIGIYGVTLVQTTGNVVDDLPDESSVIQDLKFFEKNFSGVMPFEILIDTKRKNAITNDGNLKRIEKLQELLAEYPEFSKSLSIVDASKFAKQAFYNGAPNRYSLIKRNEQSFIGPYIRGDYQTQGIEKTFMDSAKQVTRITAQVADIGTLEMEKLMDDLKPKINDIFPPEKYDVIITGTSIVFLEGTTYMVKNLFISLMIAIVIIALIMSFLFRSTRMVLISLLPNMIPLIITAAIMGFTGITIKPSTILVFSIAFGISVDDTIHFLAKYRQELDHSHWKIGDSVLRAVRETGISMLYTSIVLFFGFGIFVASEFEGTAALGVLVSVTLLVAMFTNLVLLPSLLMSLDRALTTRTFSEPMLEIIDEEEDIDLDELEIKGQRESDKYDN